ncbi:hypothetical protein LS70_002085 [Helicobacter sp. MIT 11-5569]|uniref:hypothetical protein n=1 Tax=Helicobacter sp. MIT 11-5569 TaxID=1548151 RepID=UPI00051F95B5|nr:hypothetical protein [Helicobacter sp. MIT 11-5569]TLD85356.1 hypothetical protein LS70_002085 [Helicobacter sp. MIT 11-5569]
MQSLLRVLSISVLVFSLTNSTLYADIFVTPKPSENKSYTYTVVSPLTPFDETLKREMEKYPKDSAFFVDGRTGKIISVAKPPKTRPTTESQYKATPENLPAPIRNAAPYEMQEERIELLQ